MISDTPRSTYELWSFRRRPAKPPPPSTSDSPLSLAASAFPFPVDQRTVEERGAENDGRGDGQDVRGKSEEERIGIQGKRGKSPALIKKSYGLYKYTVHFGLRGGNFRMLVPYFPYSFLNLRIIYTQWHLDSVLSPLGYHQSTEWREFQYHSRGLTSSGHSSIPENFLFHSFQHTQGIF